MTPCDQRGRPSFERGLKSDRAQDRDGGREEKKKAKEIRGGRGPLFRGGGDLGGDIWQRLGHRPRHHKEEVFECVPSCFTAPSSCYSRLYSSTVAWPDFFSSLSLSLHISCSGSGLFFNVLTAALALVIVLALLLVFAQRGMLMVSNNVPQRPQRPFTTRVSVMEGNVMRLERQQ